VIDADGIASQWSLRSETLSPRSADAESVRKRMAIEMPIESSDYLLGATIPAVTSTLEPSSNSTVTRVAAGSAGSFRKPTAQARTPGRNSVGASPLIRTSSPQVSSDIDDYSAAERERRGGSAGKQSARRIGPRWRLGRPRPRRRAPTLQLVGLRQRAVVDGHLR
jgi:hypothetical protein